MPYTAPLKSTLSAQHIEYSPLVSQSCPTSPTLESPQEGRPHLSRFYNSTAYLRKHRRSSSNGKASGDKPFKVHHALDPHGSVRQSPPPVSEALMPPGAIISPPESAPNSSDEEPPYKLRDSPRLEELEAAVRSIEQRRTSSPERQPTNEMPSSSVTPAASVVKTPTRPPLSREARKISHSRSFTEHAITHHQEDSALTSSPEESDRDDEPQQRHPMVRKKSGELVRPALRPASARRRPSSMPGTPTYAKAVHFDSQLEHIRHFLQLDKPQAVSTGTSPVEDFEAQGEFPFKKDTSSDGSSLEWALHLSNFPKNTASRSQQRVRLERLYLSSDRNTLIGVVAVANLAFQKHVAARFTFDHWKTVSEVHAEYDQDSNRSQKYDGFDRFAFSIKLNDQANLERKTMFICIRYSVHGCEYWDNNQSRNFQVNFLKIPKSKPSSPSPQPVAAAPRPALPRSRTFTHSDSRPHSMPSAFDDFSRLNDSLSFGRPSKESKSVALCEDSSHDLETPPPVRREKQSHQMFGNRYDFEASLSAVMRTKPELDRTTLTARAKSGRPSSNGERQPHPKGRGSDSQKDKSVGEKNPQSGHREESKPSTLASGKPHRESLSYKELVDRYCFFGSSTSNDSGPSGSEDDEAGARRDSNSSSDSLSPKSSPLPSPIIDVTKSSSRNSSSSPNAFGYTHHQPIQNHLLRETHTPTAIRG